MIQKEDLFTLIGNSRSNYHSAILTTFTFDPIFFNTYYVKKLHEVGIINIVILVDASNYDRMTAEYAHVSAATDGTYTIVRQPSSGSGVFHPKISLLIGQNAGLAFVGSGNLTYAGQSVNEEVWGAFRLTADDHANLPLISQVWTYLKSLVPATASLARQQLEWMQAYSAWLGDKTAEDVTTGEHGEEIRFLANSREDGSIARQLHNIIGDVVCHKLQVVAPFYDFEGKLVQDLQKTYAPATTECIIYDQGTYPQHLPDVGFKLWKPSDALKQRLHAKLYQFTTDRGTYLLLGSPNATLSAWGNGSGYANDEAAILLYNPETTDYLKALGITSAVEKTDVRKLPAPEPFKTKASNYQTQIQQAEIISDKLTLSLSKPLPDLTVHLMSADGEILGQYPFVPDKPKEIDDAVRQKLRMVVCCRDGQEVSNRALVTDENDVVRSNPNPQGYKLKSLIDSSTRWDDNIAKMLEFVSFEIPEPASTKKVVARSVVRKEDHREHFIGKDQFDDINLQGRASVLNINEVKIVDFLSRIFSDEKKQKQEPVVEADAEEADDDIANSDDYHYDTDDEQRRALSNEYSFRNFFKRHNEHLDRLLSDFEERMAFHQSGDTSVWDYKPPVAPNLTAQLTDYSAALISVGLMYQLLVSEELYTITVGYIRRTLVSIIGRFLLAFREPYPESDDYKSRKLRQLHKDLCTYTFCVAACLDWDTDNTRADLTLLALNMMDSFRCWPEELAEAFAHYEKAIATRNLPLKPATVELLRDCHQRYLRFQKAYSRDPHSSQLIQLISLQWTSAYVYKQKYGFTLIQDFRRNATGKMTYEMWVTGYQNDDEYFRIQGGEKVVLLFHD